MKSQSGKEDLFVFFILKESDSKYD